MMSVLQGGPGSRREASKPVPNPQVSLPHPARLRAPRLTAIPLIISAAIPSAGCWQPAAPLQLAATAAASRPLWTEGEGASAAAWRFPFGIVPFAQNLCLSLVEGVAAGRVDDAAQAADGTQNCCDQPPHQAEVAGDAVDLHEAIK